MLNHVFMATFIWKTDLFVQSFIFQGQLLFILHFHARVRVCVVCSRTLFPISSKCKHTRFLECENTWTYSTPLERWICVPNTLLPLVLTLQPSVQWGIFSFLEFQLTFAGDQVTCLLIKRFSKRIATYFLNHYKAKNKS